MFLLKFWSDKGFVFYREVLGGKHCVRFARGINRLCRAGGTFLFFMGQVFFCYEKFGKTFNHLPLPGGKGLWLIFDFSLFIQYKNIK